MIADNTVDLNAFFKHIIPADKKVAFIYRVRNTIKQIKKYLRVKKYHFNYTVFIFKIKMNNTFFPEQLFESQTKDAILR